MKFRPNISPIDVIKKGAFGGTYFRDIYSRVNNKFYKNSWKQFKELENIDGRYYCSDFYDIGLNYYGVVVEKSLRFWERKGWINKIDPYGWFQWYFRYWKGRRSEDDIRQINMLLHWCYELKLRLHDAIVSCACNANCCIASA